MLKKCEKCQLHQHATQMVNGRGGNHAKVMLIGEAPGYEEDLQGTAFVGKAGQLLNHVLDKLGVGPDDVFITNCLRCRPPENKLPSPKVVLEMFSCCEPYLQKEIHKVKPKVIVLMGSIPLYVIGHKVHVTQHEGTVLPVTYMNIPLVASYHPAFVLRQPSKEVCLARALYTAFDMVGIHPIPKPSDTFFDYDKEDVI